MSDSQHSDSQPSDSQHSDSRRSDVQPPVGYRQPSIVWLVEYTDERQPGSRFQAGGFTTEAEAQRLLDQLATDPPLGDPTINMVPIHHTLEDWRWDR